MAIDLKLIKQSTDFTLQRLENLQKTESDHLFLLSNFIYQPLLDKLLNYIIDDNLAWTNQEDTATGYHKNRQKLTWISDSVVEEVHTMFNNLTENLNTLLGKQSKFSGIAIWKDTKGFKMSKHSDNPYISYAIQIYLVTGSENLGTIFEYNQKSIIPKFTVNHGYLLDNSSKLPHYVRGPVPADFTRYSVYAVWTNQ